MQLDARYPFISFALFTQDSVFNEATAEKKTFGYLDSLLTVKEAFVLAGKKSEVETCYEQMIHCSYSNFPSINGSLQDTLTLATLRLCNGLAMF